MNTRFQNPGNWRAAILAVVLATSCFDGSPAWARAAAEPQATEAPVNFGGAGAEVKASAAQAPEPEVATPRPGRGKARSHGEPAVSIGGRVDVARDQVVDGAVVIRGDAQIDGDVNGDVVVILGRLKVTGKVTGDVVVVMGDAEVDGDIQGDLVMVFTRGHLGPKANVHGQMEAIGVVPVIDPLATIEGRPEVVDLGPIAKYLDWVKDYLFHGVFWLRPFPPGLPWVWVAAAVFLGIHLLISILFGSALRGCIQTVAERPARSFLVGLLTCILVGPVSILLSFTVVAIPLIWLGYLVLCVFGRVAVYGAAGAGLMRKRGDAIEPFTSVLVGSLLFYAGYMVPVLGFLLYWVVLPWGVGATLIRVVDAMRRERRVDPGSPAQGPGPTVQAAAMASAIVAGEPGAAAHSSVEPPSAPASAGFEAGPVPPLPGGAAASSWGVPPRAAVPPLVASVSSIEWAAMPRAGFWPRTGALLIDITVVAFVNVMTFDATRSFWFLLAAYHLGMWAWKGTTLGGSVLGLRLIRLDGRALDWQTCAYRVMGAIVSLLPMGLGFLWVAWDPECQSWHDRIAGTTVVKGDRKSALI